MISEEQRKREKLYNDFNSACTNYVKAFCEKHGYPLGEWIRDRVGEIIELGDYYVSLTDIRYDIDNNVPVGEFESWYDYTFGLAMLECPKMIEYEPWVQGCPRPYTEEQLEAIRKARAEVDFAKRHLEDLLDGGDY